MNAHRYSDEEAREILQRAMESDQALERGLSQDDLIEAAAEVGISREAMTRAAEALRLERLADERLREKRQGRRRRWWGDVATFATVSGFMVLLDMMTSGGPWWHWPVLGWGFFVMLGGLRAYLPKGQDQQRKMLEKEVKRIRREEAKEARRRAKEARRRQRRDLGADFEEVIEDGVDALLSAAARGIEAATEAILGGAGGSPSANSGPQVQVPPSGTEEGAVDVVEESAEDPARHRRR